MNTALVCIAKNEDHYIDEWLQYHLKLGFSRVFVYQNNWRYAGNKLAYGSRVVWIDFDGEAMQMKAYNDFIDSHSGEYDFAAFFDVDEFLCLKKDKSLESFLSRYSDSYGVGINWRVFGDNGMLSVENGRYSLLNRFTKCQAKLDRHIKTVLNLALSKSMFHFVNPHFVDAAWKYDVILDVDKTHAIHGPWNENCQTQIAQLNHYCSKTWPEFQEKMARGKADTLKSHPRCNYLSSDFMLHNYNDIEDCTARDFYNGLPQEKPVTTPNRGTLKNIVHVFSICTLDYLKHSLELAYSLCLSNTGNRKICFNIVVDEKKIDGIQQKADKLNFPNFTFKIHSFDEILCKHSKAIDILQRKTKYPKIAFAKLYLADLMPSGANTALYLDSDAIVVNDGILDALDGSSGQALMACHDLTVMLSDKAELKSADSTQYFNAGVLIVNKDAYRKVDIDALVLSLSPTQVLKYADQTFLNLAFKGSIQPLSPVFNVLVKDLCYSDPSFIYQCIGLSYAKIRQTAAVLHFAGGFSYWNDLSALPMPHIQNINNIRFALDLMLVNKTNFEKHLRQCKCSFDSTT